MNHEDAKDTKEEGRGKREEGRGKREERKLIPNPLVLELFLPLRLCDYPAGKPPVYA
jgi:hypothetical protein